MIPRAVGVRPWFSAERGANTSAVIDAYPKQYLTAGLARS